MREQTYQSRPVAERRAAQATRSPQTQDDAWNMPIEEIAELAGCDIHTILGTNLSYRVRLDGAIEIEDSAAERFLEQRRTQEIA